jgi:hypothetical protein
MLDGGLFGGCWSDLNVYILTLRSTPRALRSTPIALRYHTDSTPTALRQHSDSTPIALRHAPPPKTNAFKSEAKLSSPSLLLISSQPPMVRTKSSPAYCTASLVFDDDSTNQTPELLRAESSGMPPLDAARKSKRERDEEEDGADDGSGSGGMGDAGRPTKLSPKRLFYDDLSDQEDAPVPLTQVSSGSASGAAPVPLTQDSAGSASDDAPVPMTQNASDDAPAPQEDLEEGEIPFEPTSDFGIAG